MQVDRGQRMRGGAMAEAAFDALAVDLTVPQPRPLVDLERDEYADLEVGEPLTVPFVRAEPRPEDPGPTEAVTAPIRRAPRWTVHHVTAAIVAVVLGFGLGAGVASLWI